MPWTCSASAQCHGGSFESFEQEWLATAARSRSRADEAASEHVPRARTLATVAPRRDPVLTSTHEANCMGFWEDGTPCLAVCEDGECCAWHTEPDDGRGIELQAARWDVEVAGLDGMTRTTELLSARWDHTHRCDRMTRTVDWTRVPKGRAAQGMRNLEDIETTQDWPLRPDNAMVFMGFSTDRGVLRDRADYLSKAVLEESTRKLYKSWWATFISYVFNNRTWCHLLEGWEIETPINPEPVREYVAFLAGLYAHGTIETALAAIAAVSRDLGEVSPTVHERVTSVMHGYAKRQSRVATKLFVLTPAMVRGMMALEEVHEHTPEGEKCAGKCWTRARRLRAQVGVAIGFVAFTRKAEVRKLDRCDMYRDERGGFDINIWGAKTDKISAGRQTIIGGQLGDEAGLIDLIEDYLEQVDRVDDNRYGCTKHLNAKEHCKVCGPLFVSLNAKGRATKKKTKSGLATDFFTNDTRKMLWQLKVNGAECMRDVDPEKFTWIACRRGGNSAACAEHVAADHRRIHGRWKSSSCPDNEYLRMHRNEFASIASTVLLSTHGEEDDTVEDSTGCAVPARAQGDTGQGASADNRQRQRRQSRASA